MKTIQQPTAIDLQLHAVIEASAGTGKTYTITHLVLRLMLEQAVSLNEILLVTFTDKATSELRSRIREGIEDTLRNTELSAVQDQRLQAALRDINQASIYTIHGFCQRVLKEYAFEQGAVLDKSLVDDNAILIKQLQALKRTWPAVDDIEDSLKNTSLSMQQLDKLLKDLTQQMQPGDLIYPESPEQALQFAQKQMDSFIGPDLAVIGADYRKISGPSTTVLNNRWKDKFIPVIEQLTAIKEAPLSIGHLQETLPGIKKLSDEVFTSKDHKQFPAAIMAKEAPVFVACLNQVKSLIKQLDAVVQADRFQFLVSMVSELRKRVKQHKVSQGQISYDDMITDLADALALESTSTGQPLTHRLRDKYQVALIDEFQDTDAQQWSIFQWLFASPEQPQRLVLIGDPKQSIYGFRGANIHTYEAAKKYLLSDALQGQGYRLSTNYRSLPELTEQLNQFFTLHNDQHHAWYAADEVVVDTPGIEHRSTSGGPVVLADHSGLPAFNQITTQATDLKVAGLKQVMAEQIAQTIKQQLLGQLTFQLKGVKRTLDAGDVCVLVRGKKDAIPIERALDAANIPHTFYKKTALYQSSAAIQIQLVLTALAFPQLKKHVNNACLSLFFQLSPTQIKQLNQQQISNKSQPHLAEFIPLWLQIKNLAAQQDWVGVFYALFEESGTFNRLYQAGDWRMMANLQQVKQDLLHVAAAEKLDAHGLLHQLLEWRASHLISSEDWQQKDTEHPAVNIMTIHSSKGLEFPVVFLFGGFTAAKRQQQFSKYHDPVKLAQVFDLADKQSKLAVAEEAAENKRLYYVAMTRAVFKLFMPVYDFSTYQASGVFYQDFVIDRLLASGLAAKLQDELTVPRQVDLWTVENKGSHELPEMPCLPKLMASRKRLIHSFSSLQKHVDEMPAQFADLLPVDTVQADDIGADWATPLTDNPSIPGGPQTGNVLHGIFENLDFDLVRASGNLDEFQSNQEVKDIIESQMKVFLMPDGELLDGGGQVRSRYSQEFAIWVWHTLTKPIDALGGLCLCEVNSNDRRHEMSFHWAQSGHMLTGFIDLLFKIDGPAGAAYYILDWKSNYSPAGYAPTTLAETVMAEHNYHDQYRWYTLAVKSWFEQLQLKDARLAGALYVFSRGINADSNDQHGVFYQDLSTEEFALNKLEKQLHTAIESAVKSPAGPS